jgi:hypothetical protein
MVYDTTPGKPSYTLIESHLPCTDSAQVRVELAPKRPGIEYIEHRYSVIIRDPGQLELHLSLLSEYVEFRGVQSHDIVTFELTVLPALSAYLATFPPDVLQWVQSRPEVEVIERDTRVYLC